ncbi:hypothetical protein EV193_104341 [Herbihabitans rhizosphaerae]|uniref:Major facilitator superfamily (MFS) profile domain-containing protein n=1 Tax=Herbihabitans rhizosphaerae TaxID=1872711 RepID=A0A4Q7KRE8_9PSEU|nr:hypothetical protein [Herbihabitans rhizosphaerae]RZS39125.1 hypothetical protein EV193_104341 [Herbihabitans rhizosphaerae]
MAAVAFAFAVVFVWIAITATVGLIVGVPLYLVLLAVGKPFHFLALLAGAGTLAAVLVGIAARNTLRKG